MLPSPPSRLLTKALVSPSKLANKLDWKKLAGTVMAMDVRSNHIGIALGNHPSLHLPAIKYPAINLANRPCDKDLIEELENIVKQRNVCGFIVGWPLQPEGRPGKSCGKVLHVLDNLAQRTDRTLFKKDSRPLALWDDRSIVRDDMNVCILKRDDLPMDSFGRSAAFSLRHRSPSLPQWRVVRKAQERCFHPSTNELTFASEVLYDFFDAHYECRTAKEFEDLSEEDRHQKEAVHTPIYDHSYEWAEDYSNSDMKFATGT